MILIKSEKTDRRVKYTKMVIKESFIKLLKQKPISKISIKEICENADINRATFYAHYLNQYDLLNKIENKIVDDVNQSLSNYNFNDSFDMAFEMVEVILEYVRKNSELFNILLNSNGDINFQEEFIKIISTQHFSSTAENDLLNEEDKEYVFRFCASGSIGVIQKWLKDGLKKPSNEISKLILSAAINARSSFD